MNSAEHLNAAAPSTDAGCGGATAPCAVMSWLENMAVYVDSTERLVAEVGRRFVADGVPVSRIGLLLRTLHPQIAASGFVWSAGSGEVDVFTRDHSTQTSDAYLRSPIRDIYEGAPALRRRLADPATPRDYPILHDLDADGVTDYLVLPVPFSDGRNYACSWSTTQAGGFHDAQIARIENAMAMFARIIEILAQRNLSKTLLDTYLGRKTGQRVLDGAIYRGVNETIDAVIWISDLRRFTAMSDEIAPAVMLGVLNDHFERVVGAIDAAGGEVLKFMGDSVLAIFPIERPEETSGAARAALAAARDAMARIEARNAERAAKGLGRLGYGIALNRGPVVYGNIGSGDRLDFTVIGPAVNQTSRIEALCPVLARPVLVADSVAAVSEEPLVSLGFHALRGVRAPHEIFTLGELA